VFVSLLGSSGCGFLKRAEPEPAPIPRGHFEGPVTLMHYQKTGQYPESGAPASLDLAEHGTATLLVLQYAGVACTGEPRRVNDQLVLEQPECQDPYMPGCRIIPGQLSFAIAGDGALEMRQFIYAFEDTHECQTKAAERVEFEPARFARAGESQVTVTPP
jgi:hypothetical protein